MEGFSFAMAHGFAAKSSTVSWINPTLIHDFLQQNCATCPITATIIHGAFVVWSLLAFIMFLMAMLKICCKPNCSIGAGYCAFWLGMALFAVYFFAAELFMNHETGHTQLDHLCFMLLGYFVYDYLVRKKGCCEPGNTVS